MGNNLSNVIQLLSLLIEYDEFQPPLGGKVCDHVQESEYVGGTYLNPDLLLRGREALIVCPYFRGELEGLVSHCLIHHLLKLF